MHYFLILNKLIYFIKVNRIEVELALFYAEIFYYLNFLGHHRQYFLRLFLRIFQYCQFLFVLLWSLFFVILNYLLNPFFVEKILKNTRQRILAKSWPPIGTESTNFFPEFKFTAVITVKIIPPIKIT